MICINAGGRAAEADDVGAIAAAVGAAKRGDRDAHRYLYVRFAGDVYRYVRNIVRSDDDAEDITQQVFTKLLTHIGQYEPRSVPFKAWLLRVARNATFDALRKERDLPVEEVFAEHQVCPSSRREHLHALRSALADLPDDQREVLVLRHLAGLSPGEIAVRLGKTEGAIHGLHHRGRRAIRQGLRSAGVAPATAEKRTVAVA